MPLQHFTAKSGSVWNARAKWLVRNIQKAGKVVSHLPFQDAHPSALFSVYFRQLRWSSWLFCNQAYTQIFNSVPALFSAHKDTHISLILKHETDKLPPNKKITTTISHFHLPSSTFPCTCLTRSLRSTLHHLHFISHSSVMYICFLYLAKVF